MTPEGMVVVASPYSAEKTLARLEGAITRHGNTIFAEIEHAEAAADVGLKLRPTTLVVFGNPTVGTRLMQEAQTLGLDLPLRALVWEDRAGKVWLGTNAPAWLVARHDAALAGHPVTAAMAALLETIANETVGGKTGDGA